MSWYNHSRQARKRRNIFCYYMFYFSFISFRKKIHNQYAQLPNSILNCKLLCEICWCFRDETNFIYFFTSACYFTTQTKGPNHSIYAKYRWAFSQSIYRFIIVKHICSIWILYTHPVLEMLFFFFVFICWSFLVSSIWTEKYLNVYSLENLINYWSISHPMLVICIVFFCLLKFSLENEWGDKKGFEGKKYIPKCANI